METNENIEKHKNKIEENNGKEEKLIFLTFFIGGLYGYQLIYR